MTDDDRRPGEASRASGSVEDWLEDIEEGGVTDWNEDDPITVKQGEDALAAALKRIQLVASPSAGVKQGPGAIPRLGTSPRASSVPAAKVIPKAAGGSPAAPGGRPIARVPQGTAPPAPLASPARPDDSTVLGALRHELSLEREKRVAAEGKLAEAERSLASRAKEGHVVEATVLAYDPVRELREAENAQLRGELAEARAELEAAKSSSPSSPILAVPVGFIGHDEHSIVAKSCFAVGKGELLHVLLGSFLDQWRFWPYPLVANVSPKGLTVVLPRDPHRRSIRVLPTGALLLQMGPQYLQYVRELPPMVSRRR